MTVQRVLRDTQAQPEVTFYVGTTATDADAAVTVDILRADGTIFATDAATTHPGSVGLYRYTLAPQSNLELFTLQWEGTFGGVVQRITSQVEVVGGYFVALADLKALPGMSTKTDAQLAEGRQTFEDLVESWCGYAFVPRYGRVLRDGDGTAEIELDHPYPRRILSAKVAGVAQTGLTTWDLYETGLVIRDVGSFGSGRLNVEVTYEHGLDAAPSDLRDAALSGIQADVNATVGGGGGIPRGVTQLATDAGVMTFGRPSGPTGIAEVDNVLARYRMPRVA